MPAFFGSIVSVITTSVTIATYKKILKNSKSATGKVVSIEQIGKKYYIFCSTDQITGFDMLFKSHPYTLDVGDYIEKHNINKFEIKYLPENTKKYFIDTNKLDKIYYK